ncbi:MAG: helix-turn-helix domain-containing protein [Candidatus Jettenia caeni]|nr:MAG: helix-turn-helix domain-containing protein [Candidatus Jettenia caeni]
MKKRYANIKEVSEYTSLPIKTLYDWASQRKIPSIKYGRRVLFDLEDIDKHLQSMKRDTDQPQNIVNKIIEECHGKDYNS